MQMRQLQKTDELSAVFGQIYSTFSGKIEERAEGLVMCIGLGMEVQDSSFSVACTAQRHQYAEICVLGRSFFVCLDTQEQVIKDFLTNIPLHADFVEIKYTKRFTSIDFDDPVATEVGIITARSEAVVFCLANVHDYLAEAVEFADANFSPSGEVQDLCSVESMQTPVEALRIDRQAPAYAAFSFLSRIDKHPVQLYAIHTDAHAALLKVFQQRPNDCETVDLKIRVKGYPQVITLKVGIPHNARQELLMRSALSFLPKFKELRFVDPVMHSIRISTDLLALSPSI